jgi:Zn-finger nucleic acid-binding protein
MLLACERCHRQYDVGDFPAGARVRCACGHLSTVPTTRSRQVEMLHCASCGGRLTSAREACEYCSAEIKQADRGLGPACPECFAVTLHGARHCSACGVRLAPEAVLRALVERACPRCRQALTECQTPDLRYVECLHCGGLWLDEELFERLSKERDRALASEIRGSGPTTPLQGRRSEEVRYLPCPVCSQVMNRRNFADCSGVILDRCRGHGWWFDAEELERIVGFLEQGGMERARRLAHERRLEELRRARGPEPAPALPVRDGAGWDLFAVLGELLSEWIA